MAQPNPVVTVGSQAVNAYTCPAETCSVAVELPAGWHGVALECAPGCGWLRVQYPGIDRQLLGPPRLAPNLGRAGGAPRRAGGG